MQSTQRRQLLTLAIETSCDDTGVAVLMKYENKKSAKLYFNSKITSDPRIYGGVHPLAAHDSHQKNLSSLINRALNSLPYSSVEKRPPRCAEIFYKKGPPQLPRWEKVPPANSLLIESKNGTKTLRQKPDFITVTRGPGMRASLNTGLDTAKGLAVAWQVPLVGVNHMQAHALTPRLVSALDAAESGRADIAENDPEFPFLTLLVSGGHTMLVHSRSLCDHEILANTTDISIGDMIDKTAREVVPRQFIDSVQDYTYGQMLEEFVFAENQPYYSYVPPSSFTRPRDVNLQGYEWTIYPPYAAPGPGGSIKYAGSFTFSGIGSSMKSMINRHPEMDDAGRRIMARETMVLAFEHLASRVLFALQRPDIQNIKTVVVSGGVASNHFLKTILRENLDAKGYRDIELAFPPPRFCTDNAAMIAWAGMEMYEAGWRTSLDAMVANKWAIDPKAEDGGILGLDGWTKKPMVDERSTDLQEAKTVPEVSIVISPYSSVQKDAAESAQRILLGSGVVSCQTVPLDEIKKPLQDQLVSTQQELASTKEDLASAKEELESIREKLATTQKELGSALRDLYQRKRYMKSQPFWKSRTETGKGVTMKG
jgi:N6-L-threonylcarbamoyladenine synthase